MDRHDHAPDAVLRWPQCQASLAGSRRIHSSEREPQKVELPFRYLADACLVRVDRQLQLVHEFAHPVQCLFSLAPSAQRHRRDFLPHTRAKKLPRAAESLVYSLTPSGVLAENHPKNRGFVGILRGQKCLKRGQKCLKRRFSRRSPVGEWSLRRQRSRVADPSPAIRRHRRRASWRRRRAGKSRAHGKRRAHRARAVELTHRAPSSTRAAGSRSTRTECPESVWHTILTCGNPQWYGKPMKQRGLLSRQGGHSSRYWRQQDSVFARRMKHPAAAMLRTFPAVMRIPP